MPPAHILNAPTKLMKQLGYGKDYQYDPDTADGFSGQDYFPDGVQRTRFYEPTNNGSREGHHGPTPPLAATPRCAPRHQCP